MSATITDLTEGMTIDQLAQTLEFLDQHRAECAAEAGREAAASGLDPREGIALYNAGAVYTPWEIEARARVTEHNDPHGTLASVTANAARALSV